MTTPDPAGGATGPPDGRRTVTRLSPEVRRTQIIESAAELFADRDPLEVPFEEIAAAAGVSRSLVHTYFGDRSGLLAAVYLHHLSAIQQHLEVAIAGQPSPELEMQAAVRAYLEFAARHPGAWRLLRVARLHDHPDIVAARDRMMHDVAHRWGGTVQAHILSCAVVGALEAASVDWLRSIDEIDIDRLAPMLHDLLWRGVGSFPL